MYRVAWLCAGEGGTLVQTERICVNSQNSCEKNLAKLQQCAALFSIQLANDRTNNSLTLNTHTHKNVRGGYIFTDFMGHRAAQNWNPRIL